MANSKNTTSLSRRSALVGLASTAAVAIPATALAAANGPDAVLIDLGKTLAQRIAEYREVMDRQAAIEATWVPPVRPDRLQAPGDDFVIVREALTEFEPDIIGCRPEIVTALAEAKDDASRARLTALVQSVANYHRDFLASRRECGADAAEEAVEDAALRVDAVTDQIRALRATTLQGFAVKAMPIYFYRFELWTLKPEDMDWDNRLTRELADEMMSHLPEAPPSSSWR